jgi:hypothetical protein
MFKRLTIFLAAAMALLLVFAGCDDRGTNAPAPPALDGGGSWPMGTHVYSPQLRLQLGNSIEFLPTWVFVPQVSLDPPHGQSRPTPLVVLLAPQGEDHFYFANHGIEELLKEMIADGTIQPMTVACIGNGPTFGGYFYAGGYNFSQPGDDVYGIGLADSIASPPSGNYDDIIGKELLVFLRDRLHVLETKEKTAIGGFGQGAYGAFRAALLHDTAYGSISVTDGPLDFNGDGGANGAGLLDLMDDALNEQGLMGGDIKDFKATTDLANMFVGASIAFSPHDTVIFQRRYEVNGFIIQEFITPHLSFANDPLFDTTLVTDVVTGIAGSTDWDFHLPFTGVDQPDTLVWNNYWLTQNLESLLAASTNGLDGVNLWFGTSAETRLNFYQQTQSWMNTLQGAPYNYTVVESPLEGLDGNPATHDQYMFTILREMFIFHSEKFGN